MIELACPRCHSPLEPMDADSGRCPQDGAVYRQVEGIWAMLLPGRQEYFAQFVKEYETVRRLEGRGSPNTDYYRQLPYHGGEAWHIRARSFDVFLQQVLIPRESSSNPLSILDLGAGNGWLSNKLALRGHAVAAVDLAVNDFDGLGCRRFYAANFLCVQAEFDRLPFPDCSASMVLFNASFHYSLGYENTLRECLRVLRGEGSIVLLDSPIYHEARNGAQMVRERESQFARRYGFPSDSLPSENYLTWPRLDQLGHALGLKWQKLTPWYGPRWALKPALARLLRRREPARFHILVLSREDG